jgi:hypothetical protein
MASSDLYTVDGMEQGKLVRNGVKTDGVDWWRDLYEYIASVLWGRSIDGRLS